MNYGLECIDLTVSPGATPVLRRLSLSVAPGSFTVLVGPSGAGKTTLLHAIAGLVATDGGEIRLGDRSLRSVPANRRRIAYVFQEPRLLPHLNVVDNVALPLRADRVNRLERRERAQQLLDDVGLGGFATRAIDGLSGGEQQRVALARALCAEPDLLLLDEPLASLDPNRRAELRELVKRLQSSRDLTTLFVTHDRSEAAQLGQSVALMLEGSIVQHGDPRELFERPQSLAVASFFGSTNVLRGPVEGGMLELAGAKLPVTGADGEAVFVIRPELIRLDGGSATRAKVIGSVYAGTHVRLTLDLAGVSLEAHVPPDSAPVAGRDVGVHLSRADLWRLPGGASLSSIDQAPDVQTTPFEQP